MSTIDTSTWNPDADFNVEIEGIPLNSDASIAQTWQALRALMAAVKGDGDAIKSMIDVMQGATASADGASGLVPKPEAGDQDKFLKGDGTWGDLAASDIPALDASKITSGTIDLARLPAGALERLVTVADQTARFALTTASVQLGDTVKQLDTGLLYFVVDTAHLDSEAGYAVYTAGAATSVLWSGVTSKPTTIAGYGITDAKIASGVITLGSDTITPLTSSSSLDASKLTGTASVDTTGSAGSVAWSGVTDKPLSYTPSSHSHGSITNDGKVGSAAGKPIITGASGAVQAGAMITDAQIDALFDS